MIRRLQPFVPVVGIIYAALTTLRAHLDVTRLLRLPSAGPLSYLVFREEHEQA